MQLDLTQLPTFDISRYGNPNAASDRAMEYAALLDRIGNYNEIVNMIKNPGAEDEEKLDDRQLKGAIICVLRQKDLEEVEDEIDGLTMEKIHSLAQEVFKMLDSFPAWKTALKEEVQMKLKEIENEVKKSCQEMALLQNKVAHIKSSQEADLGLSDVKEDLAEITKWTIVLSGQLLTVKQSLEKNGQ